MAAASFFRSVFLNHFVKPAHERTLFRSISRIKPQRIVEVGLDCGERAADLIELAQRNRPTVEIRYTGLDPFDERVTNEPLTLKEAHQILKPTGATVQLIPGDPLNRLAAVANNLASTDLLVISANHGSSVSRPDWYFVPRMLHDHSLVFWQAEVGQAYQRLGYKDVVQMLSEMNEASDQAHGRAA